MKKVRYPLFLMGGLMTPWVLASLPFSVRVAGVFLGAAAGSLMAAFLFRPSRTRGLFPFATAWVWSVTFASLWVALASFSAQVSLLTPPVLYFLAGSAAALPLILLLFFHSGRSDWWPGKGRTLIMAALFLGGVLFASPGRRYEGGEDSPEIRRAASSLSGVRDALSWVHGKVDYRRAPFTDRAGDTLSRGEATCGGMANLLDKVLRAMGIPSRIVYFESKGRMHTLVEYRKGMTGGWVLADPQNNLLGDDYGDISGYGAVFGDSGVDLPKHWRGHDRLYLYLRDAGYRRVTGAKAGEFYGEP